MKSKIYLSEIVENNDRRFGSNKEYAPVIIVRENGQEVPALFTTDRVEKAIARAKVNPEDIEEDKSFWDTLLGR